MHDICHLVWRRNILDYVFISIAIFNSIVKSFFSLTPRPVTGKVKPKYNLPESGNYIGKRCMVPGQNPKYYDCIDKSLILRIASQQSCSRDPAATRNPLILHRKICKARCI